MGSSPRLAQSTSLPSLPAGSQQVSRRCAAR